MMQFEPNNLCHTVYFLMTLEDMLLPIKEAIN